MAPTDINLLAKRIAGEVITAGHARYDELRRIWNAMIDKRPAAIVCCSSTDDVVSTINYARERRIRVAVRCGGHSIPGHSMCDDGIVVDLGRMNRVSVDPQQRTARVQGGALLRDLDRATQEFGLATPAGAVSHTGVSGLALGGGFGHLMRKYGLTVDSILSIEIVLADGRVERTDSTHHPDLFWALRGGGGNFGVVTEFLFRTHEVGAPFVGLAIHQLDQAKPVLQRWRDVMSDSPPDELNWCSFFRWGQGLTGIPPELAAKPVLATLIEWHGSQDKGEEVVTSYLRQIGGSMQTAAVMPFVLLQQFADDISAHGNYAWTKAGFFSVISDDLIETLIEAGRRMPSWRSTLEVIPMGGAIRRTNRDATAFPHRDAAYVFNVVGLWESAADHENNIQWVRESYAAEIEASVFTLAGSDVQ